MSDEPPEKVEYENDRGEILLPIPVQRAEVTARQGEPRPGPEIEDANQEHEFYTDELSAHCPFDFGGPDYYDCVIRYVPNEHGVESRSLKKYVEAWREERISAEDLAYEVYEDVRQTINPESLYVRLEQQRRGGIDETVEVGETSLRVEGWR